MALLPCHLIASNKKVSSVPGKKKQMKVSAKLLVNYDIKKNLSHNADLKKFIILVFESTSMLSVVSKACCMWCSHRSAARWVTKNGRCRPIRAGCPARKNRQLGLTSPNYLESNG
jgi:hypothetical protein